MYVHILTPKREVAGNPGSGTVCITTATGFARSEQRVTCLPSSEHGTGLIGWYHRRDPTLQYYRASPSSAFYYVYSQG